MKLGRVFFFDAAHHLPDYQGECESLHGHTYKLEVVIESDVKEDGMVLDFSELKRIVTENVLSRLDHRNLNDVVDNPTAENIASWVYMQLEDKLDLCSIKLWEGQGKWVQIDRSA